MLDNWLTTEKHPPLRWIKITGRHLVMDFEKTFAECLTEREFELIIEQEASPCPELLTNIFYVTSAYYRRRFLASIRSLTTPSMCLSSTSYSSIFSLLINSGFSAICR